MRSLFLPQNPRSPLQERKPGPTAGGGGAGTKKDCHQREREHLLSESFSLNLEGLQVDPDPLIWLTAAPRQETWLGVQVCLVRPPLAFSTHARSVLEGGEGDCDGDHF